MHFIQTSGFHCTNYGIHVHEVSQWGIWSWNGRVSVPLSLTAMFWHTRSFGLRNWLASTCDVFNRFMMGPNEEGRCFVFGKELTAAGIWCHGLWYWFDVTLVTMLLLTLILALTLSSPDFLPMHYFIQIKPYIPSPKGIKKYFCLKIRNSWPQIICFEANMMILATLRNFTILGVGVTIMDINQNVSIRMYLEYLLHAV